MLNMCLFSFFVCLLFKEEGGPAALEHALGHDRDAVAEQIGLLLPSG